MHRLFGASNNFYGGTCYGRAVEGGPTRVREFSVTATTARSYVVEYGLKVNRKTMKLKLSSFEVDMFATVEEAIASLRRPGSNTF